MHDGAVLWATAAPPEGLTRLGRDDAFVVLFHEHYRGLCRLAALLLDDAASAEEAVQEAFLATFAGWRRLRHPEQARWYLRAAVVNQCRSRVRRRRVEDRGNRVAWSSERQTIGDGRDDALAVLDAVRSLPARQREAVVLRYYEDLTERETAAAMGCSVGTVKSQLAKARATLAARLGEGDGG